MMSNIPDEYFLIKLWALFHDPPDKTLSIRDHEDRAKSYSRKVFNTLGYNLDRDVIGTDINSIVHEADMLSSSTDRFITHFILADEDYSRFYTPLARLKNIFNPNYSVDITYKNLNAAKKTFENRIRSSILTISNIIEKLLNKGVPLNIIYNVIYALYEPIIIKFGVDSFPSDTRVPTHTVMDHCYATAMTINMLYKGKMSGYLVYIDIPGVHSYISKSRKMSDLWVSSYLVSSIAWYLIMELVMDLGPDIVIMPTLRFNPFYIHSLDASLSRGNEIFMEMVRDEIAKRLKESKIMDEDGGDPWKLGDIKIYSSFEPPRFAVMPSTITLIIPDIPDYINNKFSKYMVNLGRDVEKAIEKYFRNRLNDLWRKLWDIIEKDAMKFDDKILYVFKSIYECELASKYLNYAKETPPFPLRIIVKNLKDLYNDFKGHGYREYLPDGEGEYREEYFDHLFYDYIFKYLDKEMKKFKSIKLDGYSLLNVKGVTEEAYKQNRSVTVSLFGNGCNVPNLFRFCGVCSKLPAIVWNPIKTLENEGQFREDFTSRISRYGISDRGKSFYDFNDYLQAIIKDGEALCPYCLLKRIFANKPTKLFETVFGSLNENYYKILLNKLNNKNKDFRLPSHSEVTGYEFKYNILDSLSKLSKSEIENRLKKIENGLRNVNIKFAYRAPNSKNALDLLSSNILSIDGIDLLPLDIREKYGELENKVSGDHKEILKIIVESDTENALHERYFVELESEGVIVDWKRYQILKAIKSGLGNVSDDLKLDLYYACIKMDGDNVGKALTGCIEKFTGAYMTECLKNRSNKGVNDGFIVKYLRECLDGEIVKEFDNLLKSGSNMMGKILRKLLSENRIAVTPALHVLISKAMIFSSAMDVSNVERSGFVIYAGGDDLLAIVPVSKSLEIVVTARDSYSAWSEEHRGFKQIGKSGRVGYFITMPVTSGRSASIIYSHYLTPLRPVLNSVEVSLESMSKSSRYFNHNNKKLFEKDSLSMVYRSRSGEERLAIIPFRIMDDNCDIELIHSKIKTFIRSVVESLDKGDPIFSSSQIQKMYGDEEVLSTYLEEGETKLLERKILNEYASPGSVNKAETLLDEIWFLSNLIRIDRGLTNYGSSNYPLLELFKALRIYTAARKSVNPGGD